MTEEQRWRRRVVASWVVYGVGAVLCLGSLALEEIPGEYSMASFVMWIAMSVLSGTLLMDSSFPYLDTAMFAGVFLSMLGCVPSGLLLWFAGRNVWCLVVGRLFWLGVFFIGPAILLMLIVTGATTFGVYLDERGVGAGLWLWMGSVTVMTGAFWVTRRREVALEEGAEE